MAVASLQALEMRSHAEYFFQEHGGTIGLHCDGSFAERPDFARVRRHASHRKE